MSISTICVLKVRRGKSNEDLPVSLQDTTIREIESQGCTLGY